MSSSFKVVIIGGEGTGKTAIVRRALGKSQDPNQESTVAVACQDCKINLASVGEAINLELYDLPGSERYMVLNRMYLRDTNAAIIVYDSTRRESIQNAETWVQELKETAPE